MDRPRLLQPAPPKSPETSSSAPSFSTSGSIVKRASTKNKVACEPCRIRKIACDCTHPVCYQCSKKDIKCNYRESSSRVIIKRRLLDQERDIGSFLDLLRTLNNDDALKLIRSMNSASDISKYLTPAQRSKQEIRHSLEQVEVSSQFSIEFELSSLYPISYPALALVGDDSLKLIDSWQILDALTAQLPTQNHSSKSHDGVTLCDPRLSELQIAYWTAVPISDAYASSLVSLYLQRDHSCIPLFDADLFLDDLVAGRTTYCSAFLVSAILYLASMSNSAPENEGQAAPTAFFNEAERLWRAERTSDGLLVLAASQCLSLGCLLQGKDRLSRKLMLSGRRMAERLHLFNVAPKGQAASWLHEMAGDEAKFTSHVAWGAYNWFTLHVFNYRDDAIAYPPNLPIPGESSDPDALSPAPPLPHFMGRTFTELCKYFTICQEIANAYFKLGQAPQEPTALAFAEAKYRKLLTWSESLPEELCPGDHKQHHSTLIHMWFHATILDLFRPFVQSSMRFTQMRSFSSSDSCPDMIFATSHKRLKQLVLNYCQVEDRTQYSPFIGSSILHVLAGLLGEPRASDWKSCLLTCLRCCADLYVTYSLYGEIAQALLSISLRHGLLTNAEAQDLMQQLRNRVRHHKATVYQPSQTSMVADFNRSVMDPRGAQIANLVGEFNDLTMHDELTINTDYFMTSPGSVEG